MRSPLQPHPGRLLGDTLVVFLADILILPTGLITAVFLTRTLGPTAYGLFTLSATLVFWIQGTIATMYTRVVVAYISTASDWRPVARQLLWLHLLTGGGVAIIVFALADAAAAGLHQPTLGGMLRLFCLDIVFFSVAQAYRNILSGLMAARSRALVGATRWLIRLAAILLLVGLGFGIRGAILGCVAASASEILVAAAITRVGPVPSSAIPLRHLLRRAAPLSLAGLAIRLFEKLDVIMLQVFGAGAAVAGFYGAAQNLSIIPSIFGSSSTPLLLAAAGRAWRAGGGAATAALASQSLRAVLLLLPLAAAASSCAEGIVGLIFGPLYAPTAPLLAILIFGSIAVLSTYIATAFLVAVDRAGEAVVVNCVMLLLVLMGHILLIPVWGAVGAATATTLAACCGALGSWLRVRRLLGPLSVALPLARVSAITALIYAVGAAIPAIGLWVLLKLPIICALAIGCLIASGDITDRERDAARRFFGRLFGTRLARQA
jgi:O-antigen/teichoic acid export membrane protein